YGISDEIHQSFVPGRNAGIIDIIADTIGGAAGGFGCLLFLEYIKNR
ncbi:MAG: VanZ family protein, partial [Candidatus Omnitrophica bacterium]|nr:VanZ family protein [Candidatus Omnitrophota bacterium]